MRCTAESGNTFHPYVEAYLPKSQHIRDEFSTKIWYNRQFDFENQAKIPAEVMHGDFFLGRIQLNHHEHPTINWTKKQNLFVNIGPHQGINTSWFNPSIDFGVSINMVKKTTLKNFNEFNFGMGGAVLRKNIINLKEVIDLGNKSFLASLEAAVEFTKFTSKKNDHSFGLHYQLQTRYNQRKETSYLHLKGNWDNINAGWHHGFTTLYDALSAWAFLYSYGTKKYKQSLYLKEDFLINNAPDVQTGISLKIPIVT